MKIIANDIWKVFEREGITRLGRQRRRVMGTGKNREQSRKRRENKAMGESLKTGNIGN